MLKWLFLADTFRLNAQDSWVGRTLWLRFEIEEKAHDRAKLS